MPVTAFFISPVLIGICIMTFRAKTALVLAVSFSHNRISIIVADGNS